MAYQKHTEEFDPSGFVHSAQDTYRLKQEYDKFIASNPHLQAPVHITGLEGILPPQLPGQLAVHYAKSHHGKSTALRNAVFKAQRRVEDTDSMVAIISLEDTAETTAAKFVNRYKNSSDYKDDQMIFIGNSFGMSSDQMGQLNIDNIDIALSWALNERPGIKRYSHIFFDYIQIVSESENALSRERRDQAFYATKKLFDISKKFQCPVDFASQALLKGGHSSHTGKMRIPGSGDLKEAAELYEIPHIAFAYWMPKRETDTPIGTVVEDGNWKFKVEPNLIFVKVDKWRDCELLHDRNGNPFDVVGRIFPCWIQADGEIFYDKQKHIDMVQMRTVEQKENGII